MLIQTRDYLRKYLGSNLVLINIIRLSYVLPLQDFTILSKFFQYCEHCESICLKDKNYEEQSLRELFDFSQVIL